MHQQVQMQQQQPSLPPQATSLQRPPVNVQQSLTPNMDPQTALQKLQEALVAAQANSAPAPPLPNSFSFSSNHNYYQPPAVPQPFDNPSEFGDDFGDDVYDDDDQDVDFNDDNSAIV